MSRREDRYYLTNSDFLEELKKYKETKVVSEELGEMFEKLSYKVSNKANFYKYPFKDEMIREGILTCLTYIDNFDPEKSSNPFSYFTTVCYRSFQNFIKKEKKQISVKESLTFDSDLGHKWTRPKRMKYQQ